MSVKDGPSLAFSCAAHSSYGRGTGAYEQKYGGRCIACTRRRGRMRHTSVVSVLVALVSSTTGLVSSTFGSVFSVEDILSSFFRRRFLDNLRSEQRKNARSALQPKSQPTTAAADLLFYPSNPP